MVTEQATTAVQLDDALLTVAVWGEGTPTIILLHDGLGSIAQWRSVPAGIARCTGRTVLVYDRAGHGSSSPVPTGAWPISWLDEQADVLGRLITHFGAQRPLIVGHSDGGTIALLHAATSTNLSGVVALAAHTWAEDLAVDHIAGMRIDPAAVIAGLSNHHTAPAELFEAWSGAWTSKAFRSWDIRPLLAGVSVPVLVVQGFDDEFATDDQATLSAAAIGENAECRLVPDVHHLIHHEDPELVIGLVTDFATPYR